MNNTMEYKGYVGSVEFSEEDALFYGKFLGIRALISYSFARAVRILCAASHSRSWLCCNASKSAS